MGLSPIWRVSEIWAGAKWADVKFGVIRANKLFTNIPIWGGIQRRLVFFTLISITKTYINLCTFLWIVNKLRAFDLFQVPYKKGVTLKYTRSYGDFCCVKMVDCDGWLEKSQIFKSTRIFSGCLLITACTMQHQFSTLEMNLLGTFFGYWHRLKCLHIVIIIIRNSVTYGIH